MNLNMISKKTVWMLLIGFILFWGAPGFSAPSGTLKWSYKTGGEIKSTPAVGLDGTIYFGSNDNHIYALNPDGTLKWKYNTKSWVQSSPVVGSDGVIYCASNTISHGLFALNPNGTLKWKAQYNYIKGAIVLGPDDDIYFSDHRNVYALNSKGIEKWRYFLEVNYVYPTTPAVGLDGTIYFGCGDSHIYALNPNGSLKWKYKTKEELNASSPAIGLDGTIYAGSEDGYLYAFDPNGSVKWQYKTGKKVTSSPAVGIDGTIFCGSWDGYMYALNPDGNLKWKYNAGQGWGGINTNPFIGVDGTIYVATFDGWIYALNSDGTLKWNYGISDNINSSPALAVDGTLYIGADDNYMYALNNAMDYHYSMPVFKPRSAHWSGLGITNLSRKKSANVTVTVYSQAGTILDSDKKFIPARGQASFWVGTTLKNDGWIKILSDMPLSGMNLMGEYIGTSKKYYLADVPFTPSSLLSNLLVIPHVAQNTGWDTIAFLANPNVTAASVTITYVPQNGAGTTPYLVSIPASGSREIPLSTVTSTSGQGGYAIISSTQGLTAFALYHNLKTGNFSYAGINAVDVTKR